MLRDLKLITGNSNLALAREIAQYIGQDLSQATVTTFSDGEIRVRIDENVRGGDVFLIQSCCHPVNTSIMELLLLIDAVKRSSASRITAVIPYYGYGRQDRKDQPRVPISAKLIADLITAAGANRILTMDLHAGPIQGFFNIPVDHLYAMPVMLDYIKKQNVSDLVIVSPDAGGVERARAFAKRLNSSLAIIDKRRESPNQAEVMNIIGDVQDKHALLFDDMIDTAGTIVQTAQTCMDNGALSAWAGSTHAVLSGPALERLQSSCLREVMVTNTIPLNGKDQQCPKLKTLTVAPLLGEAILRIHREESVTSLFV
ncbi:ribose-phosphate diphosphokinase [Nitrospira sp. T9]|uniref:Ribose-phosphate pyrophosphokinase n=1 Tax=Candidatus Nitrospira neomarina TaxID=3020899 RepID=A0AA96JVZ9_9BACT|nr:ribose-phosphate pyrophosphokinase [Candidatus Nitrospira neomarina]WNM61605.1 ribose-phosphate pyrophosphokinase [Candidatus Nitrospira neomarina]